MQGATPCFEDLIHGQGRRIALQVGSETKQAEGRLGVSTARTPVPPVLSMYYVCAVQRNTRLSQQLMSRRERVLLLHTLTQRLKPEFPANLDYTTNLKLA